MSTGFTDRTTMHRGDVTITPPTTEPDTTVQYVGIDHAPTDEELQKMGGALFDAIQTERAGNARQMKD